MSWSHRNLVVVFAACLLVGSTGRAMAQNANGQGTGQGRQRDRQQNGGQAQPAQAAGQRGPQDGGQGGGNFDPQQMRQMMLDRIKQQVQAPDDEWQVLLPRIEKVMDAQREARSAPRGRGGVPGQGGDANPTAAAQAAQDLQAAIQNGSLSQDELTRRVETYKAARDGARQRLIQAQQDLIELLTPRQEGVLVSTGMLD